MKVPRRGFLRASGLSALLTGCSADRGPHGDRVTSLDGYAIETSAHPGQHGALHFVAGRNGKFAFRCSVICGAFHPYMIGYLKVQPDYRFLGASLASVGLLGFVLLVVARNDGEEAMVFPPPKASERELRHRVGELPLSGGGSQPRQLLANALELNTTDAEIWGKLALNLYDGGAYREALEGFYKVEKLAPMEWWTFAALVWQGHLLDLLGRREEALAKYRQALKMPGSPAISQEQYGMQIDRKWVEDRLQKPFRRESRGEPTGLQELP